MKKIFTILAVALISASAFAQVHNVSITIERPDYVPGTPVVGDKFSPGFVILKNEGPATITFDDQIGFAVTIQNTVISSLGSKRNFSTFTLKKKDDMWLPGQSTDPLSFKDIGLTWNPGVVSTDICAVVWDNKSGIAFDPYNANGDYSSVDTDASDNTYCITFMPPPVGVQESLSAISKKVYVANGILVIEGSDYNFEEVATVSVTDISGKTVLNTSTQLNSGRSTISLENYNTGIYLVKLAVGNNVATTKVYKK